MARDFKVFYQYWRNACDLIAAGLFHLIKRSIRSSQQPFGATWPCPVQSYAYAAGNSQRPRPGSGKAAVQNKAPLPAP